MTASRPADANQGARPVVSVICDAQMGLRDALIQALAEVVPGRINPQPAPLGALEQRFAVNDDGARNTTGHIAWPGGSAIAARLSGHNDAKFARHVVIQACHGLIKTLENFEALKPK